MFGAIQGLSGSQGGVLEGFRQFRGSQKVSGGHFGVTGGVFQATGEPFGGNSGDFGAVREAVGVVSPTAQETFGDHGRGGALGLWGVTPGRAALTPTPLRLFGVSRDPKSPPFPPPQCWS